MYFGHRVCRAFDECKRLINNVLNPVWKRVPPTLPSGLVPADVLYWVRRESWNAEALERAKASVRQQHSRIRQSNPEAPKFDVTQHVEAIDEVAKEKPFKESWFPKCWFVFVLLGLSSAQPAPHFSSGLAPSTPNILLKEVMCTASSANRRLSRDLDPPPVRSRKDRRGGRIAKKFFIIFRWIKTMKQRHSRRLTSSRRTLSCWKLQMRQAEPSQRKIVEVI